MKLYVIFLLYGIFAEIMVWTVFAMLGDKNRAICFNRLTKLSFTATLSIIIGLVLLLTNVVSSAL